LNGYMAVTSFILEHDSWLEKLRRFAETSSDRRLPYEVFCGVIETGNDSKEKSKILRTLAQKLAEQITFLENPPLIENGAKNGSQFYVFNLSKDGRLTRTVENTLEEYAMEESGRRHQLVKALNHGARNSFHSTKDLAGALGVTSGTI